MIFEKGNKIKLIHLKSKTSRVAIVTRIEGNVVYYMCKYKEGIIEFSSNIDVSNIERTICICDRCLSEANPLIMSMFNTEMICTECKDKEKVHDKYKDAHEIEHEQVSKANYNYYGVGLPDDLKPKVYTWKEYVVEGMKKVRERKERKSNAIR